MSGSVSGSSRPVMLDLQGYGNPQDQLVNETESKVPAVIYKIPPVVWMLAFLVAGYLGVRKVMED